MNKPAKIEEKKSYVPVKVETFFNDTSLSIGSAFFYLFENESYLITNWHIVSGRNPQTEQPLLNCGAIPNKLSIKVPYKEKSNDQSYIQWKTYLLELYEKEKPVWYVHPTLLEKVDIACIKLRIENTAIVCANDNSLGLEMIRIYPSLDVFILGFPFGMFGGASFPLWKRGTIASEPDIDIDNLPKFYVDTATREGMSGSPVYAQEVGMIVPENAASMDDWQFGKSERFIGVYSGRIGAEDEFKVQIGIVWKMSAIEEILENKIIGKSSLTFFEKET